MSTALNPIDYNNATFNKSFTNLKNGKLTALEYTLLNEIYSKMDMSRNNPDFYDRKFNDHYAIITRAYIFSKWNVKGSTVGRAFKHLADMGYIIRKRAKSGAMKLFTPHLAFKPRRKEKSKITVDEEKSGKDKGFNTTNPSSSGDSSNNTDLSNHDHKPRTQHQASTLSHNQPQDTYLPKRDSRFEAKNRLSNLFSSLRKSEVPEQAIKAAYNYYHDHKSLDWLFGTIFQAKDNARKLALRNPQDTFISLDFKGYDTLKMYGVDNSANHLKKAIQDAFYFEKNTIMAERLASNIRMILSQAHHKAEDFQRYVFGALRKSFKQSAQKYVDQFVADIRDSSIKGGVNIPIL